MSSGQGNLIWLDRLNAKLPSYTGYLAPAGRGASDASLREAISYRLESARRQVEHAIAVCQSHETDREIGTLRSIEADLAELADRVKRAVVPSSLFDAAAVDPARAEAFHRRDHELLEAADHIAESATRPGSDHDWIPSLKAKIRAFDARLDERILGFNPQA